MKNKVTLFFLVLLSSNSFSQNKLQLVDSLKSNLTEITNDSLKIGMLHEISYAYVYTNVDSSFKYAQQEYDLSKKTGNLSGEARSLIDESNAFSYKGIYTTALELVFRAIKIGEQMNDSSILSKAYNSLGILYVEEGNLKEAINCFMKAHVLSVNNAKEDIFELINLGITYLQLNMPDSALSYSHAAYQRALEKQPWDVDMIGAILRTLGEIEFHMGHDDIALAYFKKSIPEAVKFDDYADLNASYFDIAKLFRKQNNIDSTILYLQLAMDFANKIGYNKGVMDVSIVLSDIYKPLNKDSTLKYLQLQVSIKDSLFNQEKTRNIERLSLNEKIRQQDLQDSLLKARQERTKYLQLFGITVFIITFVLFIVALSRYKASKSTAKFLGVVALLLVFEFVSLLIHPKIEKLTNHNQVYMLLILLLVASLLVPLHHKLESWIKQKLDHKHTRFPRKKILAKTKNKKEVDEN